jgi:hypothetical protein
MYNQNVVSDFALRKVNAADLEQNKNRTFIDLRIKHGKFSEFLFPLDWVNTKMARLSG